MKVLIVEDEILERKALIHLMKTEFEQVSIVLTAENGSSGKTGSDPYGYQSATVRWNQCNEKNKRTIRRLSSDHGFRVF